MGHAAALSVSRLRVEGRPGLLVDGRLLLRGGRLDVGEPGRAGLAGAQAAEHLAGVGVAVVLVVLVAATRMSVPAAAPAPVPEPTS